MLSLTSYLLSHELKRRGYQIHQLGKTPLVFAQLGDKQCFFDDSIIPSQSGVGIHICKNKYLSKLVYDYFGYQSPKWVKINKDSQDEVTSLKFPVVIKPLNRYGGEGVVVGVSSIKEVQQYFRTHPEYEEVLVEEMLQGYDVRVLVVKGKFFAAVKREPASVTGDGKLSIDQLIEKENLRRNGILQQQKDTRNYICDLELIKDDHEVDETLLLNGYARKSILQDKQKCFIRRNANVSTGGMAIDVTDLVCTEIQTMCGDICQKIGMTLLGVDIMTQDVSKPLDIEQKSGIVEINASPGLGLHVFPGEGKSRNPVSLIVDEIEEYLAKMDHGQSHEIIAS